MMQDIESHYLPDVGEFDGTLQPKSGTTIRMSDFDHRRVPDIKDFSRQLSQRFGVQSSNWEIILRDSEKTATAKDATLVVGKLSVETKENTKIEFAELVDEDEESFDPPQYAAFSEDGKVFEGLEATFEHEDVTYPITGWMGYSKLPYRDDLMAGVRIYCRGKIAAQTHIFNLKAGFTGEYDVRSYLVGELNADWLDDVDDLIRTDRQDILWSSPIARAFEKWGQKAVKAIGTLTREPMRKATWDTFREATQIEEKVSEEYPGEHQEAIREKTLEIAQKIVKSARPEELQDKKHRDSLMDLALMLGPHITLEDKLTEAGEGEEGRTLEAVTGILRVARVAELTRSGGSRMTVIAETEPRPTRMIQMGGAENWLGCHLISHMALQRWFSQENRPVPRFLYLDQLTGAFYPPDGEAGMRERALVRAVYKWLFTALEQVGNRFQLIIVDHADLSEDWFQNAVVEKWWGENDGLGSVC